MPEKEQKEAIGKADPGAKPKKSRDGSRSKGDDSVVGSCLSSPMSPAVTDSRTRSSQGKIDSMLKSRSKESILNLESMLKSFENKLASMASQETTETQFRKMEDALTLKLDTIKEDIRGQVETIRGDFEDLRSKMEEVKINQENDRSKISDLETQVDALERDKKLLSEDNSRLFELLNQREAKMKKLKNEINDLEQYSRRNSIRIYGVHDDNSKETPHQTATKVVQILKNKLNMEVEIQDIDVAHRTGKFLDDGNRPILCKFVTRLKKFEAIKSRSVLKGTPLVIKEDLTARNVQRMNQVKEVENVKNVWSDEGKIIALLDSDDKVLIDYKTDLIKPIIPKRLQKQNSNGRSGSYKTAEDVSKTVTRSEVD